MKLNYAKILRRIAVVLAVLFVAGFAFVYHAAPYMILTPRKYNVPRSPADLGLPFEKITVQTSDTLQLRGYWVHQPGDTGKTTIILLHGIGGCKEHWLETAAWLWQEGYETVMMDSRAHGESEGQYCTYGYREKYDVSAVTDYVLRHKTGGTLGIWGNSLGGAIAVQALSVEPRLRFGIIESAFSDFRTIVFDYQRRRLKIPWHWFANDGIARATAMAHFDPDAVRPSEAARLIRRPVFVAHGDADDRIKPAYGRQIFANLASPDKTFYSVAGAGHLNVMAKGGPAYKAAILDFLRKYR